MKKDHIFKYYQLNTKFQKFRLEKPNEDKEPLQIDELVTSFFSFLILLMDQNKNIINLQNRLS